MITSKTGHFIFSAALLIALAIPAANAQAPVAGGIDIYAGQSAAQSGITVSSWGSGDVKEVTDIVFNGSASIKLMTHGRYQGARFTLPKALDVKAAVTDPYAYLQLAVKLPAPDTGMGGYSGGGGYPGGPGMPGGNRRNRQGNRGGSGASGGMGNPGGNSGGQYGGYGNNNQVDLSLQPKAIANIRVVLVNDDGKRVEIELPTDSAQISQQVWSLVAIPISMIPNVKDNITALKEVHVFGDSVGTVYLGAIQIIRDETPIRVDEQPELTVAVNDNVTFTAVAEAGPTALKYEWNFGGKVGNAKDAAADAEGRVVKHQFRKSGDYTVTLTVRDLYGVKKPASTKTVIHVTL